MSMIVLMVTAHRPPKLGGYNNDVAKAKVFERCVQHIRKVKPDKAIQGMALGGDQIFGWACISEGIPFIAAVPFLGQENRWPEKSRKEYLNLLSRAESVHFQFDRPPGARAVLSISDVRQAMQQRNMWMSNHSTHALAIWDGSSGGTGNCVRYLRACVDDPNQPMRDLEIASPKEILEGIAA
jgi:uncharacterized phage-like protein YoqJ